MTNLPSARSALIVSVAEYENPKLRRLRTPAHDAEELARVLGDSGIGDFAIDVSLNEPEYRVRRRLTRLFRDRTRDDLLLVHFSCHGLKDEDGRLYFAAADTDIDDLEGTAVASEFVNGLMARSLSRRIILLLDCCYSGAFAPGTITRAGDEVDLKERFEGSGRVVLTASSSMEYSFEGDVLSGEGRPSVFTSALVDGLSTGAADVDEDGLVSFDDLSRYVADAVRERTPNQTPRKWAFDAQGDLIVARSPRGKIVRPAPLPADLVGAIESPYAAIRAGAVTTLAQLGSGRNEGLALSARLELEKLANDDSRQVASAAAEALGRPPSKAESAAPGPAPAASPVTSAPPLSRREAPIETAGAAALGRTPTVALAVTGALLFAAAFASLADDIGAARALLLEPLTVGVVAALIALGFARRLVPPELAVGLLIGFGLQTTAAGIGWLGGPPGDAGLVDGVELGWIRLLVPLGGGALLGAAYAAAAELPDTAPVRAAGAAPELIVRGLSLAGAAVCLAALGLPMRTDEGDRHEILREGAIDLPWVAMEPVAVFAAVAVTAAAIGMLRRRAVVRAALLLALGTQTVLYFVSYVLSVELHESGSYGPGGILGIFGAALIVAAGLLDLRAAGLREDQALPATTPG